MGNQSTLNRMPKQVRDIVVSLYAEGVTIEQVVAKLTELGHPASKSAVGRHKKRYTDFAKQLEETRAIAAPLIASLGADQSDDVGRALVEALHTTIFQVLAQLRGEDGDMALDPAGVMMLSKSLKDLASAKKISTDRELKLKQETAKKAVGAVEEVAKEAGLSGDTVKQIKARILGVVTP